MGLTGFRRPPTPHTWSADPSVHAAPLSPPADIPVAPAPALGLRDRERLRRAAYNATKTLPAPVAEWIERELRALGDLALAFDPDGLTARLVEHLIATGPGGPAPGPPAA